MRLSALLALVAALFIPQLALAKEVLGEPTPWGLDFQHGVTPVKDMVADFHWLLLVIITAVTIFVLGLLLYVIVRYHRSINKTPSTTTHNTMIEVVWTVVPILILIVIAIPSFRLLYYSDKAVNAEMTVKAIGHQWYWEYEYPDQGVKFSSYMVPEEEAKAKGLRRLLDVDQRLVVPVDTDIQVLITANDVIHAWAVPSLGVKKDAVPGRINETWFRATRTGTFYGQCSEICGNGHGYMPIAVEVVSKDDYAKWLSRAKKEFAYQPDPAAEKAVASH